MASAVLASQNETSWPPMGKILESNPNPKKKQKRSQYPTEIDVVRRYQNSIIDGPAVTQTASDDAYSFNQTSTSPGAVNFGSYLTFDVAKYTKSELIGLRKRFYAELDQIRNLSDRIESGQFGIAKNPGFTARSKKVSGTKLLGVPVTNSKGLGNGFDVPFSDVANTVIFRDMLSECKQILTKLLKLKCGWVFKAPVDVVRLGLHDYHMIVKRPMDLGTVKINLGKNVYSSPVEFAADVRLTFNNALLYNPKSDPVNGMAQQMLARFEELFKPLQEKIDSFAYHRGESRENWVSNGKHVNENEELQDSSWHNYNQFLASSPSREKKAKPKVNAVPLPHVSKKHERLQMPMQAHSSASTASNPPPSPSNYIPVPERNHSPVGAPIPPVKEPKIGRGAGPVKQPKPRAKDQNKRDMSMEEKQKLGIGLQCLPQEKLPQLVQIISKRNERLARDGDEIELDIEALDTETLWELDRFVTNWKKLVSKTKRQAMMVNNNAEAGVFIPTSVAEADVGPMYAENDLSGKKLKENDEEDVDIDDDLPATSFPPVEIEKDERAGGGVDGNDPDGENDASNGSTSSSSSSSSGSSSSTDSGSGGSSGSDSDADDAQS